MGTRKLAVSIPEKVIKEVDRLARKEKQSRSGFITRALIAELERRRDDEITAKLNEVHSDPEIAEEQRRDAAAWLSASTLEDERW